MTRLGLILVSLLLCVEALPQGGDRGHENGKDGNDVNHEEDSEIENGPETSIEAKKSKPLCSSSASAISERLKCKKSINFHESSEGDQLLITSYANFKTNIGKKLISDIHKDNFVVSPFINFIVAVMLTSGATKDSQTQKQLQDYSGIKGDFKKIEKHLGSWLKRLQVSPDLSFSNRIWTTKEVFPKINLDYINHLNETYLSDFDQLPEENPDEVVKDWFGTKAEGINPNFVDNISSNVSLMISSAFHSNIIWNSKFTKQTEEKDFHLIGGDVIKVPMMQVTTEALILERSIISNYSTYNVYIPLKSDFGCLVMVILMFEYPDEFDAYLQNYKKEDEGRTEEETFLEKMTRRLEESDVKLKKTTVTHPIFSLKSSFTMDKYMKEFGVIDAFENGDFQPISNEVPLKISSIIQVSELRVGPEGTTGLGGSGLEASRRSLSEELPDEIVINKPFAFILLDLHDAIDIVFHGSVKNPLKHD